MSLIKTLITVFLLIATTPVLMAEEAKVGVAKVGVAKPEEKNTAEEDCLKEIEEIIKFKNEINVEKTYKTIFKKNLTCCRNTGVTFGFMVQMSASN